MKGIYIFLADGFEDMEGLGTLDVLRRAGLPAKTVCTSKPGYVVTTSHGVTLSADLCWDEFLSQIDEVGTDEGDMMIFPGGMPGTKNLAANPVLIELMNAHYQSGGSLAAICAAPGLVLSQLSDVNGLRFTCFEGFQDEMLSKGAEYIPEGSVCDRRIITGRGAGHAINFALKIVSYLKGNDAAQSVKTSLMLS